MKKKVKMTKPKAMHHMASPLSDKIGKAQKPTGTPRMRMGAAKAKMAKMKK